MPSVAKILKDHQFPLPIIALYEKLGITEFFPPQAQAVEQGAFDRKNLLLAVPTAAGKTLVAELCMLKAILQEQGRCLYIVPLKALASEKAEDFHKKFSPLGINVGLATSDMDDRRQSLNRYQILVATAEKVDALLRAKAQWLINALSVAVIDEIHFINDGSRGPTLEVLTARLRQLNPKIQILALSATVSNAHEMAQWLKAELIASQWRPIPLKEGVYFNEQIKFHNSLTKIIKEDTPDDLGKLVVDTVKGNGQVLVFVNSRRSAQAASRQLCKDVAPLLSDGERQKLFMLAKTALGSAGDNTKVCRQLGEVIKHGAAFHHAGLKPQQRKLIEENFKNGLIKVICSTPTLAAGVNLPARRAVIRDVKRFEDGLGSSFIPASEYKQCAGRAGRPQFDEYGEAVLIAKSLSESKLLLDRYIKADPEPVNSQLGQEAALKIHILASIAGGYTHDVNDALEFLSHTFLAHQRRGTNFLETVSRIFAFLEQEGFIEKHGFRFLATPFGELTSRLYLNPESSLILRDGLKKASALSDTTALGLLHLLVCCPDNPLLKLSNSELETIERFAKSHADELIVGPDDCWPLRNFLLNLSITKTVMMLDAWLEETREEEICDTFNIGPGDIYRHSESIRWLVRAALAFSELWGYHQLSLPLVRLQQRIRYGIKEELTELTQLKGIGRVRARNLFSKGFKKLTDLKRADLADIAAIPQIGKTVAESILEQISGAAAVNPLETSAEDEGWE